MAVTTASCSRGVLGGFRTADEIVTNPIDWYADRDVKLRTGTSVTEIDRERGAVRCSDGRDVPFDALVIATGSRSFLPPIEGIAGPHVHVFRTIADCEGIRAAARGARHAVVLGGGLLGLEAAYGLRALGVAPTVVHLMPTLMEQQLDRDGGLALQGRIEAAGIAVRTNARAARFFDDAGERGVELADGTRIAGDLIVVCCGIVPNVDLARAAGLAVERGVVVDDGLQTSDPRIFAIGECAQHAGTLYGLVEPRLGASENFGRTSHRNGEPVSRLAHGDETQSGRRQRRGARRAGSSAGRCRRDGDR